MRPVGRPVRLALAADTLAVKSGLSPGEPMPARSTAARAKPTAPTLVKSAAPPLLELRTIERLLGLAMARGADFAEVYV